MIRSIALRLSGSVVWICAGLSGLLGLSPAEAFDMRGNVGPMHDWALRLTLEPSSSGSPNHYSGPLSLRHTGICTAKDHGTKTGTADATLKGRDLYALHMTFDGQACSLAGPVPVRSTSTLEFMRCDGGNQVAISIWSDEPELTAEPARR